MAEDKKIDDEVLKEVADAKKKEEKEEFEEICFICRRPESKTGKMVRLANNVHICPECMQRTFDSMSGGQIPYSDLDLSQIPNMPNIGMINLADLANQIPRRQKIKKKKTEEQPQKAFDVKSVPAPHKIKESLDEYVIGQEHAKKVISLI